MNLLSLIQAHFVLKCWRLWKPCLPRLLYTCSCYSY